MIQTVTSKTWNNIPENLKALPFWLSWYYNQKPDRKKLEKVPNIGRGKWNNKKLYSFSGAIKEFERCQQDNQSRADGIGIAFTNTNSIIGIDIDGIDENAIPAEIKAILEAGKSTYIEKSVSGNGFHIIGTVADKSLLLSMMNKYNGRTGAKAGDQKIELYLTGRYFTVSGNCINNNFGDISFAFVLAWEYITKRSALESVAVLYTPNQCNDFTQDQPNKTAIKTSVAIPSTPNQRSGFNSPKTSVAVLFPPRPADAFSDEEIAQLPKIPIKQAIKDMYHFRPILKKVLESDGHAVAPEYYKIFGDKDKDKSPSGFDMEITSSVMFYLYRYNDADIIDFLQKSKIQRKTIDYIAGNVKKARETAIEYYHATNTKNLTDTQRKKLNNWMKWKKDCAKIIIEK